MKRKNILWIGAGALALAIACGAKPVSAQGSQDQSQKPATDKDKQPLQTGDLTLNAPTAPGVNPEEEAAFKAFQDARIADMPKKLQLGEDFATKYPRSRYLSNVYSMMVIGYSVTGQAQNLIATGEKELALNPNDVNTLAMLSQAMPRTFDPKSPTATLTLDKAEQYGKRAIDVITTLAKPENMTDEGFAGAKAQVLSLAHAGIGTVYWRRGNSAGAIPELDQAVKLVKDPDPVNLFLLGIVNENTSHFDDAAAAFTRCADIPGPMQANCKAGVDDAKKKAATQLSAPK